MTDSAAPAETGGRSSGQPLWRWLAAIGVTAVLAAAIVLVLGDDDGDSGDEDALVEVFQLPVAEVGPDPFTEPVADEPSANISTYATAPPPPAEGVAEVGSLNGAEAGLYGGTLEEASCDADQLVAFLESDPEKAAAWAGVLDIAAADIGDYVSRLTPLLLPADTRVTNHGFEDGQAYALQSVLQAGTAVLVDDRGVPRVRCYCGNPLLAPEAASEGLEFVGEPWSTFDVSNLRIVLPAATALDEFVVTDVDTGTRFTRPVGSDGSMDAPTSGGDPEPPPGDDALSGPVEATGPFEEPEVAGVSFTYLTNRITLRFDTAGGPVTGDAQIVVSVETATVRGSADFTGTFDAASGMLSGSLTSVGQFGGFNAGGTGNWTARFDPVAATVEGSISNVGGPPTPFSLTVRGA